LKNGRSEVGYAIEDALDIVVLPNALVPSTGGGLIAGVALHDGAPLEVLDPFAVFSSLLGNRSGSGDASAPLCLIDGEDGWLAMFVKPMLEQAGYRVALASASAAVPDVVLTSESSSTAHGWRAPVVHLGKGPSSDPDGSVSRYDKAGILAALDQHVPLRKAHA